MIFLSAAGPSSGAIVAPTSASGSGSTSTVTSNSVTVSWAEAVGPLTYSWSLVNVGTTGMFAVNASSATTAFRCLGMTSGEFEADTATCLVTDTASGTTSSVSLPVTIQRT